MPSAKDRANGQSGVSAADASMPNGEKRKPGRPKGTPASEKQRAASKENMRKARAAAAEQKAARDLARQDPGYKQRWKMLEDGDIDVSDLTNRELYSRQVSNDDGTWTGVRHALPNRIVARMEAEFVRRMRRNMSQLATPAFRALRTRLEDDDVPAQQFAAAKMVIEYGIGKVPDVIHVGAESAYDRLQQEAFIVLRGDGLRAALEQDKQGNGDHEDIVEGELVEEEA